MTSTPIVNFKIEQCSYWFFLFDDKYEYTLKRENKFDTLHVRVYIANKTSKNRRYIILTGIEQH